MHVEVVSGSTESSNRVIMMIAFTVMQCNAACNCRQH